MAIRYGLTAPPDPLRLPQLTWMPPTTQTRRRVPLPPPPPKTDSTSTTDQSQQTMAPDPEPEGQGTQRPRRARARGRYHGPALTAASSATHLPTGFGTFWWNVSI